MNFVNKKISIAGYTVSWPVLLWFFIAALGVSLELSRGIDDINNYLIFKGVFTHVLQQKNLYLQYPAEYADANHYGPTFSLLIAPFALLNNYAACFLWCMANAAVLFYAVSRMHISNHKKNLVLLICLVELMTATQSVQFNPLLAGGLILSFVLVEEENDFWATFFIAAGFLVKLYGIAGLAFFLFSKQKTRFIFSFIFWLIVLFCLPMLLSSPTFIVQCYSDWFQSLVNKNTENVSALKAENLQDISVMGIIRRVFNYHSLSNTLVIIPAVILFMLPYLRIKQYKNVDFRTSYLAVVLITVVIYSSSAESPTYIIAVSGAAIWFIIQSQPYKKWVLGMLVFLLVFTSLSATDIFPHRVKAGFFVAYALKALPCFCIWMILIGQLLLSDFTKHKLFKLHSFRSQ